jgi:hypothetical protein
MEKFSYYHFKILKNDRGKGFVYEIYDNNHSLVRESDEWFEYEGIARFAAIGHISLLESGEG